jgi:hypothetical protein
LVVVQIPLETFKISTRALGPDELYPLPKKTSSPEEVAARP